MQRVGVAARARGHPADQRDSGNLTGFLEAAPQAARATVGAMRLTPKTTRHAIDGAPAAGRYLAAGATLVPIMGTVTRLGRSLSADVEIDDVDGLPPPRADRPPGRPDRPARRRQPQRHLAQRHPRRPRRPPRRRHDRRSGRRGCATSRSSRRRPSRASSSPREVLRVDRALGLGPARERQRRVRAGAAAPPGRRGPRAGSPARACRRSARRGPARRGRPARPAAPAGSASPGTRRPTRPAESIGISTGER